MIEMMSRFAELYVMNENVFPLGCLETGVFIMCDENVFLKSSESNGIKLPKDYGMSNVLCKRKG